MSLDLGAARERVRVARALGTLPALAEALARGELSYAKVRALTRIATPETEARLLAVGRAGTAAHVESLVRGWRRFDGQADAREATRQHAGRALHVHQEEDGTVVLRGRLTPEAGALLLRALDAARETLVPAPPSHRGRPQRAPIRPPRPRRAPSSRPTPWPCWSRRRCVGTRPRGTPGSGTRWWCTWTPRSWRSPATPGQSVLEDGRARSRGNVAAAGVRREPGGDAA